MEFFLRWTSKLPPVIFTSPIRMANFTTVLHIVLEDDIDSSTHITDTDSCKNFVANETNWWKKVSKLELFVRLFFFFLKVLVYVWYILGIYNGLAPKGLFVPSFSWLCRWAYGQVIWSWHLINSHRPILSIWVNLYWLTCCIKKKRFKCMAETLVVYMIQIPSCVNTWMQCVSLNNLISQMVTLLYVLF